MALPPCRRSRATDASTRSGERLTTARLAPATANASAMPRLMPLVPPATKTDLPVKSNALVMGLLPPCRFRAAAVPLNPIHERVDLAGPCPKVQAKQRRARGNDVHPDRADTQSRHAEIPARPGGDGAGHGEFPRP